MNKIPELAAGTPEWVEISNTYLWDKTEASKYAAIQRLGGASDERSTSTRKLGPHPTGLPSGLRSDSMLCNTGLPCQVTGLV